MYKIANSQRDEIIKLLSLIQELPDKDLKTVNYRRRAKLLIKKLNHSKQIAYENKTERGTL